ncbi:PIM2 kinase, partial [Polypterus senegalus]|nr:PIM2 kinase [Polypterus senegalus]
MLVLELPEHSVSLFDFAQNNRTTLTEKRASLIFHQIVKAVQHCHGRGVSHNDLKLDNVLIELPTEQVKIIDFGNALFLEPEEGSHHVGMGFYAPPGCFLQNRSRTFPLTVKTLGTLLYEMLCQSTYFEREFKINHNIFNCKRQLSMGPFIPVSGSQELPLYNFLTGAQMAKGIDAMLMTTVVILSQHLWRLISTCRNEAANITSVTHKMVNLKRRLDEMEAKVESLKRKLHNRGGQLQNAARRNAWSSRSG